MLTVDALEGEELKTASQADPYWLVLSIFIQTESDSAAASGLVWAQWVLQNGHGVTYEKKDKLMI